MTVMATGTPQRDTNGKEECMENDSAGSSIAARSV